MGKQSSRKYATLFTSFKTSEKAFKLGLDETVAVFKDIFFFVLATLARGTTSLHGLKC
jgi:hypothetical protein